MASPGPLRHRAGSTQRGLQPRAVPSENSMETVGLHATYWLPPGYKSGQFGTPAWALFSTK
eukprot:6228863-Prymnesium_polylepis.1